MSYVDKIKGIYLLLLRLNKNKMIKYALLLLTIFTTFSCKDVKNANQSDVKQLRIVSLSGAITETLVELGQKDNIVGIDITSTYPKEINDRLTQLDHVSKINIESIIALKPSLVYITKKDLTDNLAQQLNKANIKLKVIDQEFSVKGTKQMITDIAKSLNIMDYDDLLQKIDNDLLKVESIENKPRVLFIYARGSSNMFVAGDNTPMQKVIELASGQNAVTGFDQFKPLSPEALISSNPDYILMFDSGLQSLGGVQGVLKIDGIAQTNAGKYKRVISLDGLLLSGFTPRLGQGVRELNKKLLEK